MKTRLNLIALGLFSCLSMAAMAADAPKDGPMGGACKADVESLCKGVPGGGRIATCLKEHKDQVSDACKAAIKSHHGQHKHRAGGEGGKGDEAEQ